MMDISKYLAKVLGIYLVIVSTAMLFNLHYFMNLVNDLINNSAVMFMTGFFTLILGILMVVSHNVWQTNWRVVITILAWLTLLKGIGILFHAEAIDTTTTLFLNNATLGYIAGTFYLFLGFLLSYFGFRKIA